MSPAVSDLPTRGAASTRQRLLDSAYRRFAQDGYAATTVRDIAEDAGANVALICRYFDSKEGLFEACLTRAKQVMGEESVAMTGVDQIAGRLARHLAGASAHQARRDALLLILRSSGDPAAERIRIGVLLSSSRSLAALAADASGRSDPRLLLRAQCLVATAVGIASLRAFGGLEPISSASQDDLEPVLTDIVDALLKGG